MTFNAFLACVLMIGVVAHRGKGRPAKELMPDDCRLFAQQKKRSAVPRLFANHRRGG